MSTKLETTNPDLSDRLYELKKMLEQRPVTIDSEVIEKNKTLMLILYGAVMKMGIAIADAPNGVLVTAQTPVLQPPPNHDLRWEIAADAKSVLLYIVDTDTVVERAPGDEKEENTPSPVSEINEPETVEVGNPITVPIDAETAVMSESDPPIDEFEDAVVIGLDDNGAAQQTIDLALAEQDRIAREEMDDGN